MIRNLSLLWSKIIYYSKKRESDLWVFGEWYGNRCNDNCFYFADYIVNHYPNKKVVWIYAKGCDYSSLNSKITCYEMDSPEAISTLKRAGFVFVNQGLSDLTKRHLYYISGAVTVNFWHGVPWKKIGSDLVKNKIQKIYSRCIYKLFGFRYYVSLSHDFTQILHRSFCANKKNIIETGYPRNAVFYNVDKIKICRKELHQYISDNYGYLLDEKKKIILYLPTFRDRKKDVFSFETLVDNGELNVLLEKHNAIIIQKMHFVTFNQNNNQSHKTNNILNISNYNTQALMASADILITDYSSCFFDYLILNRPIIHFIYDYDYYKNDDRGLYYDKEEVCSGAIANNVSELIRAIDDYLMNPQKDAELRRKNCSRFVPFENNYSCETIFHSINNN